MYTLEQEKFGRIMFFCTLLINCFFFNGCATTGQIGDKKGSKLQICPNPVYYTDFSAVPDGMIPDGWIGGSTFSVKEGFMGGKKLVTMRHDRGIDHSFMIPNIDFPRNFRTEILIKQSHSKAPSISRTKAFRFRIGNLDFSVQRTYVDIKYRVWEETYKGWLGDSKFEIRTGRRWSTGSAWSLPSEKQLLILEKDGSIFRLFANGHQLAVLRKPDFEEATSIGFRCSADKNYLEIYKIEVCDLSGGSNEKEITLQRKKRPPKLSAASFYYEDFSNIESGLLPEGWIGGETFAVRNSNILRGRKVLGMIKDGKQYFETQEIDFPEDFKLDFEMILLSGCCDKMTITLGNLDLVIHTNGESRLGNTTFRLWTHGRIGSKGHRLPVKEVFLLTLKKQGPVFKIYINNSRVAMTRKSDFEKPTRISFASGRGEDDHIQVGIYKIVGSYLE